MITRQLLLLARQYSEPSACSSVCAVNSRSAMFIRFVDKVTAHKRIIFDTRDLLVLDLVQRRELVTTSLRSRLEFLRGRGIVESVGRGRGTLYVLSRAFYAQLNENGIWHPPGG